MVNKQPQTMPRLYVETDTYSMAVQRTEHILDTFDKVIVAFSGGKDSTAVLNIALQVAHSHPRFHRHLPLRTVFWDEEAIPIETEEYVRRVSERDDIALEWLCLPVKHRNACSRHHPYWWPWAPEDEAKWCRPMPEDAITEMPGFPNWPPEARLTIPNSTFMLATGRASTALLMGIRAQESLIRLRAVSRRTHEQENYIIEPSDCPKCRGNIFKAYPIYDMTTDDVWTAAAEGGWDYNRAYDLLEKAGISPSMQRCSPAFGEEPLEKIHTYAMCFPDVWAKMSERVPGIGAAQRYALTELWSYRKRPEKPAGMPWPVFLLDYVNQFRGAERAMVADRLREAIRRHYRKVSGPIVYKAFHPATGLSWDWLLRVAIRGDFKKRKQEAMAYADSPVRWFRYIEELQQVIADGRTEELGHPLPLPDDLWSLVPPAMLAKIREGDM